MSQLNFYVPVELEAIIRKEARQKRMTVSAFLADLVKRHLRPTKGISGIRNIYGKWEGTFPEIERLSPEDREGF